MLGSRTGSLAVLEGSLFWKYEAAKAPSSSSRPTILFFHAGITDHMLWDAQVDYLTARGWNCLRFDLFGFGRSKPSREFLDSDPRQSINHMDHVALLLRETLPAQAKVIAVGLSMGGGKALEFSLTHPESVAGVAAIAGGVRGFDFPSTAEEDKLFDQEAVLLQALDIEGIAKLNVRIWGDGPLQNPGRLSQVVSDKLYSWSLDIAAKECLKEGGEALEDVSPEPVTSSRIHEIKVPAAVAYGTYDETSITAVMKHIGNTIPGANVKEFRTAHMINLEVPDEFNDWLGAWLDTYFVG